MKKKNLGGVMLAVTLATTSAMTPAAEVSMDQIAAEEAARIAAEEAERLAAEEAERAAAEQAAAEEAERAAAEQAAAEEAERAAAEEAERAAAEEAERAAAEQAEAENQTAELTEESSEGMTSSDADSGLVGDEILNLTEEQTETADPESEILVSEDLAEQETEITSEGYVSIPGTVPEDDPTLHQITDASEVSADISGFSIDISSYPAADLSENTRIIYQYLVNNMGLNHAAACGVLANIQLESGFNQLALGDGGTSYGICQWHNERFSRLMSYCGGLGLDYNTVEGQLAYLENELSSSYANVLNYLRSVPDTADGAYNAGYYWCVYFEAPSDVYSRAAQRGNLARYEYYPLDFSTKTETVTSAEEGTVSAAGTASTAGTVPDAEEIRQAAADVRELMDSGLTKTDSAEPKAAETKSEDYYLDVVADLRRKMEESSNQETGEDSQEVADRVRRLLEKENNAV